ncbi:MAG: hypothetical protein V2B20_10600 [Pseudomonadota bacterium]
MKRTLVLMYFNLFMIFCAMTVQAGTPLGGLAVALSPGGEVLATAGDSRVLFVIDREKMEVTKRVWLGVGIINLQFNKDGSSLLAEDTDGTLHLIDSKSWQVVKKLPKAQQMTCANNQNLVAGLNPDYSGHIVRFLSMVDLSDKGQIIFPKGEKVQAIGLDAGGGKLAVLMESINDVSEPKGEKPPTDLKDLALEEFHLKNDGRTALLKIFNVPGGEIIREQKLYYSPSATGCRVLFQGENVLVVNYSNINAQINPEGGASLFRLDNSYNYGLGCSVDQTVLLSGGLAVGTYTMVDGLRKMKFQSDHLPGWPEYFKSFAVAADGTAYGSTSGYRVIKIKAGGVFEKSVPVY